MIARAGHRDLVHDRLVALAGCLQLAAQFVAVAQRPGDRLLFEPRRDPGHHLGRSRSGSQVRVHGDRLEPVAPEHLRRLPLDPQVGHRLERYRAPARLRMHVERLQAGDLATVVAAGSHRDGNHLVALAVVRHRETRESGGQGDGDVFVRKRGPPCPGAVDVHDNLLNPVAPVVADPTHCGLLPQPAL